MQPSVPTDANLMAHLFRRAGFGATRRRLNAALRRGYEASVEDFISPAPEHGFDDELLLRYHVGFKESRLILTTQAHWLYRMIHTTRPLEEKMTLFWHSLFATGFGKLNCAKPLVNQVNMLRRYCLTDFRTLLLGISRDPAMIFWLDNQENTAAALNENYGRELLELFTIGIGNYTENDIRNCARAFTGWSMQETVPGDLPYGRFEWTYRYRPELHDDGDKTFFGHTGRFNGENVIDIILQQPSTARFLSYRLHRFFVADMPDDRAVDALARTILGLNYDLKGIMRELFLSGAFRSRASYFAKVKSPVEHVVGLLRLTGELLAPTQLLRDVALACKAMGQELMDPPTVEGWHTGVEWLDTARLMERVNFAVARFGNPHAPGVGALIADVCARKPHSAEQLIDDCLDALGALYVAPSTRTALSESLNHGAHRLPEERDSVVSAETVVEVLQMIAATPEFQLM